MEVIVHDEYLSVAIGKKGQNVRLASKLTGWRLDVKSDTRYKSALKDGYDSLMALPGVEKATIDSLYEKGVISADELRTLSVEDLMQRGMDETEAAKLLEIAHTEADRAEETEETEEEAVAAASSEDTEVPKSPGDVEGIEKI
jgi:N utilization substance protein A